MPKTKGPQQRQKEELDQERQIEVVGRTTERPILPAAEANLPDESAATPPPADSTNWEVAKEKTQPSIKEAETKPVWGPTHS
jgi:hypothetical protein